MNNFLIKKENDYIVYGSIYNFENIENNFSIRSYLLVGYLDLNLFLSSFYILILVNVVCAHRFDIETFFKSKKHKHVTLHFHPLNPKIPKILD